MASTTSGDHDERFVAAHFPGKPDGAYLDTASVGLVPATVLDEVRRRSAAFERGMLGSPDWNRDLASFPDTVRTAFGVAPEVAVTLMSSTGDALNAVAQALDRPVGSHALAYADDFPSVHLPFAGAGWDMRLLPTPASDRTSELAAAMTEQTAVVAVSHVHAATGEAVDLARLREAADAVGAVLVVDGAHGAGVLAFSMNHADVYTATGYKWLNAGFGHCLLLVAPGVAQRMRPRLLGHGNIPPSRELRPGHENLSAALTLLAALGVRQAYGPDRIAARITALAGRLREWLADTGFELRPGGAGIVSVVGRDADSAVVRLRERGIVVAARQGLIRLSPSYYTADAEIERAASELAALA